jgi:CRP-like cAMP-binding protein
MKELKKQCDPASCLLCRSVQQAWLPAVEANSKIFQLKKGETLFKEGDPMPGMYFIHQGLIKVHKHWDEEKELILRFAKGGDIVGHRGLGIDNIYPVTATVLETTEVCYVDNDFFQATLKMNPDFLYQLMLFFAAELKESERRMRNLAHMPVKGRIAQALTRLQEKFGKDDEGFIALPVNRQDFASYLGATYETTFRLMNEMEAEGLIRVEGKKTAILQPLI